MELSMLDIGKTREDLDMEKHISKTGLYMKDHGNQMYRMALVE